MQKHRAERQPEYLITRRCGAMPLPETTTIRWQLDPLPTCMTPCSMCAARSRSVVPSSAPGTISKNTLHVREHTHTDAHNPASRMWKHGNERATLMRARAAVDIRVAPNLRNMSLGTPSNDERFFRDRAPSNRNSHPT